MPVGIYKNSAKNKRFPALFGLQIAEKTVFCSKVPNKISPKMFFEEYINLKFSLLKALSSYTGSKFRES